MTMYLISFPSRAMEVADDEWEQVGHDAHEVSRAAKDAGLWVFGGGLAEKGAPVLVADDGTITPGAYPEHDQLAGGFAILELSSRGRRVAQVHTPEHGPAEVLVLELDAHVPPRCTEGATSVVTTHRCSSILRSRLKPAASKVDSAPWNRNPAGTYSAGSG